MTKVRTRIAPSPTGYLHVGVLRTAIYTYCCAKKNGGTFILRLEDTDQKREVEGAAEVIYSSLKKAGLNWDEGPGIGGDYGPYIQSQRKAMYLPYAQQLVEKGAAYYCFCSEADLDKRRSAVEAAGGTFKYDKHCLHHVTTAQAQARIAAGEPYVIRQNVPTEGRCGFHDELFGDIEVDCAQLDDNVLIKADGLPTYNFANVIDDHLMEITHVIRGNEYLSSAPKYDLLYHAFGWGIPKYVHVSPVMKDATRKISKRHGDASFEDLLAMGYLTDAIVNYVALVGWNPGTEQEFFSLPELVEAFDLSGISKSPGLFDMEKLRWFNAEYIRRLTPEQYAAYANPWLDKALGEGRFDRALLCTLLQPRTEVFSELPEKVAFLAARPPIDAALYVHKKSKCDAAMAKTALALALPALQNAADWSGDALYALLGTLAEQNGMKASQMLWPLRVALSGLAATPGGATDLAVLLGREETLARVTDALHDL